MKKQFAVLAAITFASVSMVYSQDTATEDASVIPESPGQESIQPSDEVIEEPSGAQPDFEVPAPPPTPPDFDTPPVDPSAGAPGLAGDTNVTTVTVSQTFTNAQNAITVVGKVNSEEEKQKVEQALSEALPGKEINNHLVVSGQQIAEPAGAETPEEQPELDDQEDDIDEVERDFELQGEGQSETQSAP